MIRTDIENLKPNEAYNKEVYTIYSLVNLDNGKRYIGRTRNPGQRIRQHFNGIKSHKHPNLLIRNDSNCQFGFEILEENISFAERKNKEREYIQYYKTYEELYGYNGNDHCIATIKNPPAETKKTVYYEIMTFNTEKIRRLRLAKGLSQVELAKLIGCASRSSVCQIENGSRNCTLSQLNRIAFSLGVSPLSLVEIKEIKGEEGCQKYF